MPQNFELRIPNNGMNKDDESRLMEDTESRFILNLRSGSSEDDNVGGIENIKGTTEVVFDLPDGNNVCIGSYGDQTTHSNFFFIFNSLGDHTIFRYLPDTRTVRILVQGPVLSFQEEDLINDIDVIDNLLYWNDGVNPQRKINIDKADSDEENFRQCFNYYLGDKYVEPLGGLNTTRGLELEIRDKRYSPLTFSGSFQINLDPLLLDDKKELAKDVATQFNAISSINGTQIQWDAESCGEFVEINIKSSEFYSIYTLDQNGVRTSQIIPQNHYQGYIERTIDVIKHPPHCNPTAKIKSDEDFKRNFIKDKVFQFACKYIYDDNEKTVVSPHSPNIYNPYVCEQFTGDTRNNYIEIELDVYPELFILDDLQTLKRIELFVREGELGLWESITTLEQYEFVDISDTHFKFKNNFKYKPLDQEAFIRQYHNVPIFSKTQEVVKNRLFYANNLEQQDPTCIDAAIDVTYDDVESRVLPPTYSVSGILMIRSMFNGNLPDGDSQTRSPSKNQAIRRDVTESPTLPSGGTTDFPIVWGGISEGAGNDPVDIDMAEGTGQILPRGGFTVYLAGTDFHTKTKQNTGTHDNDIFQDLNGVYFTGEGNGGGFIDQIRENMREDNGHGLDLIDWGENNDFSFADGGANDPTQVYSTFSIDNVPDGWYILRIASHTITDDDILDPERGWQRTSTNTYRITNLDGGVSGGGHSSQRAQNELLIHVQGGDISRIKAEVMDLSHGSIKGGSKIMTGYLCDHDIDNPVATYSNIFNDNRIAGGFVSFDIAPDDLSSYNVNFDFWKSSAYCTGYYATTDYNGYYYYASIDSGGELSLCSLGIRVNGISLGISQNVEKTGKTFDDIGEDNYAEVAIRISSNDPKRRVKVQGSIIDNFGQGVSRTSVVSIRGEVVRCDLDGEYLFYHYAINETVAGNPSQDTYLIPVRTALNCSVIYDNIIYNYNFDYGDWQQNPSTFTAPSQTSSPGVAPLELTMADFIGDVSNQITINAMKRGWDGKFGIVYYDRGLRSSSVNTDKTLELHIPFYSEDYSTDKIGVPILSWEIKHSPPSWATHWQWLRTKNETLGSYFQWAVKDVSYTDNNGATTPYNSATRVKISISNIVAYKELYPTMDLQVSIDNEKWRIRFIKSQSGTRFTEYHDFKILSFDSSTAEIIFEKDFDLIELDTGALVEIYDEKADLEEEIFFEFAECFEVGTDANGNKYHKGLDQDQDPINPSSTPALGRMRTGDAYYRLRYFPETSGTNSPAYIDDDAVSDMYFSEVESIGRANGINPDFFQKWKPNQIRHGGKYIPDSNVNDLSTFLSDDFQPLPINFGDINKLQLASNVLLSIHEFRWVSNYIEEGIIRKQNGTNEIVASTKVFDSFRAAKPITGTINPESVREWRGKVYAVDINKGLVNKYDANGLTAISAFKMVDFFSDASKKILNSTSRSINKPRILGFIDIKKDEYIISTNDMFEDIPSQLGKSASTSQVSLEVKRSFTVKVAANNTLFSVNSIDPENTLVFDRKITPDATGLEIDNKTTSNGILKVKVKEVNGDVNDITTLSSGQGISNFDLESKTFTIKSQTSDNPSLKVVSGNKIVDGFTVAYSEKFNKWTTFYSFKPEMFGDVDLEMLGFTDGKLWIHNDSDIRNNFYGVQYTSILETVFNSLPSQVKVFEATGVDSYYTWSIPSAKTPNGMETEVVAERFVKREDSFHAPIMRDKNDPLAITPQDGIINGRQLRDRTILVRFENKDTEEVVLFSVSMLSTISTRHGK